VKFPLVTSFFIASAIFVGSAYVADKAALRISYRHREAMAFSSLGKRDGQELRTTLRTLSFLSLSHLMTKYEPSTAQYYTALEANIPSLQKLRSQAPERLRPLIDLQLAIDYAEMAQFEQKIGHVSESGRARQSAQALLGSLGWKDVSEGALNSLADQEIEPLQISEDKK
jgi:hypothetical protein